MTETTVDVVLELAAAAAAKLERLAAVRQQILRALQEADGLDRDLRDLEASYLVYRHRVLDRPGSLSFENERILAGFRTRHDAAAEQARDRKAQIAEYLERTAR